MLKAFTSMSLLTFIFAGCPVFSQDAPNYPESLEDSSVLWEIRLGTHQYTVPKIDNGQIFIGINDVSLKHPGFKRTGGGIFMCLEQETGDLIWQLVIPRYMEGTTAPFHFNHWKCGICSSPAIDGDKLYIVGSRGDVLCIDRNANKDGNDGPFVDELQYMPLADGSDYQLQQSDGDIIWRYDMLKELNVIPHDVCGNSPLLHGEFIYVSTSNGQDDQHKFVPSPDAPTLIALHKKTGKLAATDSELIGRRTFHGNWSSPILVNIKNREMIIFGAGDGILYAFQPVDEMPGKPQSLKKIWQCDCNPGEYRVQNGKPVPYSGWKSKNPYGPSEINATPVFHEGRIYVAIGQSPVHGPGRGALSCIDAETGKLIWRSRDVDRSLSGVVIKDGLLYIPDYSGRFTCIDIENGQTVWQFDMKAGTWSASPFISGDRIFISNEKNVLWTLQTGREQKVLGRTRLKSMGITPVTADGKLYLPTQRRLTAYSMD